MKYFETQRNGVREIFDEGLSFLIPFLLCFKIEEGNEKISYTKIKSICRSISYFLFVIGINKRGDGKIDYIQNNLTDLFADFKAIPVGCLLKCEDDLMVQKYDVTSSDLLKELLMVFQNRIFNPKTKIQTFEPSDFIDNFSSIIDTSGFIINKDYKSYNLCDDLSVYGHVPAVNVTASDLLLDSVVSCGCDIDHSVRRPFYGQDLLWNGHVRFFLLYSLYIKKIQCVFGGGT